MPFFGPPLHQHATSPPPQRSGRSHSSFTLFGCGSAMAAVSANACHRPSIHHLRPSATVAAWHPGPAAPFRGRRRFALSSAREPRCASLIAFAQPPPLRLRSASPTPGERGNRRSSSCRLPGSQPLLARARDSLCLPGYCRTDSGGPRRAPNNPAIPFGVNRPGCVPCRTGSRLLQ